MKSFFRMQIIDTYKKKGGGESGQFVEQINPIQKTYIQDETVLEITSSRQMDNI